jgi:dihydromonapterin reductase/dihydrofolate reductase
VKNVVLITGVGKRLGFELAKHCLSRGEAVVGTIRTEHPYLEELRAMGADLYPVDFYQQQQVDEFVGKVLRQYSSLSAVVHNASDWLPDNVDLAPNEIIERMMTIHVSVPYQLNLAFRELLENADKDFSDIIHISDYVSQQGSKKHIAYAASKAALNNLTLSFAALMAPKVKVNSVSPALIKFNPDDDDAYKQKAFAKALIPSEAGFDEVISGIGYIRQSAFMTGRNLQLDGGRHLK